MNKKNSILLMAVCMLFHFSFSQVTVINPHTDMRLLKDFENRKLGLFLHFLAVYTPQTGDSWNIGHGVSKATADSITLAWDPEKFDAKKIIDFAVNAGCKYIVVISKHHDGFSIWDSKYTDFDLQKLKFKKDILKELGQEARKRGLLFGIYYSIADLHYTGWQQMPSLGKTAPEPNGGKDSMVHFVHNQVKELIDNYQPDILWFDGYWLGKYWTREDGRNLYNLIKTIKPNTLSTRLSITKDSTDKYETFIPDGSSGDFFSWEANNRRMLPNFPWEGCTSITYPEYGYDPKAKIASKKELIYFFDKTICDNGNFLLNIGPERDGTLPKPLTDRFLELSSWISQNKEAVYNSTGGPFKQGDWGGSTYKDNKIFLHIRKSFTSLQIDSLDGYKITSAKELATGKELKLLKTTNGYDIGGIVVNDENIDVIVELKLNRNFTFLELDDYPYQSRKLRKYSKKILRTFTMLLIKKYSLL